MTTRISIVIPVFNEEANVRPLVGAVRDALVSAPPWELLLVDDGSRDGTAAAIAAAAADDARVRAILLARNYGQTTALQAGFDHASGDVVVTLDGDLQNDPLDIPALVAKLDEGYDLVVGYRRRREDTFLTRKVPSWVANRIIRWVTGVAVRDNGCSLKAYRRGLLVRLRLYSDMHRFIPALAAAVAGARVTEVPVRHHARRFGRSKYGLSRVLKVLTDLCAVGMLRSFRDRPLVMFASGAVVALLAAIAFGVAAVFSYESFAPWKARALVLPGAGLLCLGLAVYLLMLGLIAEVALRRAREDEDPQLPLVVERAL